MLKSVQEHVFNIDELVYYTKYAVFGKKKKEWWKNVKYYNDLEKKDITFCYDILKSVSRSFSEIIKNLPQTLSLEICVFYLILRALDTVEDDITAFNGDKEKRAEYLKTFYESFTPLNNVGEPLYRPLIQNYDRIGNVFKLLDKKSQTIILDITKRMGEGMVAFVLNDYKIKTIDNYNNYCNIVAGLVGEGLVKLIINKGYEDVNLEKILLDEDKNYKHDFGGLEKSMGLFLQKTNIIRDYKEDIEYNKKWWPEEIWKKYKNNFKDMGDDKDSKDCLNEMILDALELIPDVINFHEKLSNNKVFEFCIVPQIMAIATLDKCFDNPKLFEENIKIRKGMALKIMESVKTTEDMYAWFYRFIINIKNNIRCDDPNKGKLLDICNKILIIIHKQYKPPLITTNVKIIIMFCISLLFLCIVFIYLFKILIKPVLRNSIVFLLNYLRIVT
jgi:farnesyl-diphosphate farnesyltransferase